MIKIKKIKPMFTAIVTTMDKYEKDQTITNSLIDVSKIAGSVKEYQKVIAVGDSVRNIKVGDLVSINPQRYAVMKHDPGSLKDGVVDDNATIRYKFDTIELDNKECLLLQDRDVNFIIEEYEEIADPPVSTIIKPHKKKFIV